jgi:protein O-mannosyl-transferase
MMFNVQGLARKYAPLVIIALGLVLYANSFPNQLFWDDENFILKNNYIQDWRFFPRLFTENIVAGSYHLSNYWRPLLLLIFSVEWHLWQGWVWGWHIVNTVFHIASAVTLYFILNRLTASSVAAFLVALLFLAHPIQTEAVVYANSLGDSLGTLFIFLGLFFFLRSRQDGSLWDRSAAILMFPLALMSKETGIILSALIPLMDFLVISQKAAPLQRTKNVLFRAWPFWAMAAGYIFLRATVLNFDNTFNFYSVSNAFTQSILVRIWTFCKAMSIYISLLFVPTGLQVERTLFPIPQSIFSIEVLAGAATLLVLFTIIAWTWKTRPLLAFGAAWFLIGLAPVSNILVPINAMIYEHWLYVPMIGIALIVVILGDQLAGRSAVWRKVLLTVYILALALFGLLVVQRNSQWRTAEGFYFETLRHAPNSYRVLNNLAVIHVQRNETAKAEELYKRAIVANPMETAAYNNLGWLYMNQGKHDEALPLFEKAHALDEKYLYPYEPLIYLYRLKNDEPRAHQLEEQFSRLTSK